jgi:hypothetical protein
VIGLGGVWRGATREALALGVAAALAREHDGSRGHAA